MSGVNCVCFRGGGTETAGSVAHRNKPQCPTCGQGVSFRGRSEYDSFEKKGPSAFGVIAGTAAVAALTIGGLAYAHKANAFGKLGEGKVKDLVKKLEPAAKKCHEWCTTAKNKSLECWNKITGKV